MSYLSNFPISCPYFSKIFVFSISSKLNLLYFMLPFFSSLRTSAIYFWNYILVFKLLQSCLTLWDSMDTACQAPLSMWFSRQDFWSGLPFPSQEDLPNSGIEPASLASLTLSGGFFTICTISLQYTFTNDPLLNNNTSLYM